MEFNFRSWIAQILEWETVLEAIAPGMVKGPPVKLHFPKGEYYPPVDLNSGKQYSGPGLICFDFDQTTTCAFWAEPKIPGQPSSSRSCNKEPNPEIKRIWERHEQVGNVVHLLTARGVEEDKLRKTKRHIQGLQPIIGTGWDSHGRPTAFDRDIQGDERWSHLTRLHPAKDVSFMGGVKQARTDKKGPKIAHLMLHKKLEWAILYDDGPPNIESCEEMQQKGWAIHGILVKPNFSNPEIGPADFSAGMSHSGM
jgi:hypothetical protein